MEWVNSLSELIGLMMFDVFVLHLFVWWWSLGHLGGIGFCALLELEDAQKNRTWIYHICIRMFVRSWPAWWYQFMYTKNAWIYIYIYIYTYHNMPSKTHHPMQIFVNCFGNFLGLCQAVDKVQMLVLKTYSFIRSQVCDQARKKSPQSCVFFCDFVGVYLYDIYDIRKNFFIVAGDLRFSMEAIYIYILHIYSIYIYIYGNMTFKHLEIHSLLSLNWGKKTDGVGV